MPSDANTASQNNEILNCEELSTSADKLIQYLNPQFEMQVQQVKNNEILYCEELGTSADMRSEHLEP